MRCFYFAALQSGDCLGRDSGKITSGKTSLNTQSAQRRSKPMIFVLPFCRDASAVIGVGVKQDEVGRGFVVAEADGLSVIVQSESPKVGTRRSGRMEDRQGNGDLFEVAASQRQQTIHWINHTADKEIARLLGRCGENVDELIDRKCLKSVSAANHRLK